MKCPVCHKPLQATQDDSFLCPENHGVLLTGAHLIEKDEQLVSALDSAIPELSERNHEITCPHCSSAMHRTDYNGTGIMIDSCIKCHYRWLDGGEFRKIVTSKPQLSSVDAAFIEQLGEQMTASQALQSNDVNPAYRLSTKSGFSSPRAFGFIAAQTVAKGLRHSKYTRIATVVILIIMALVYRYVISEFN